MVKKIKLTKSGVEFKTDDDLAPGMCRIKKNQGICNKDGEMKVYTRNKKTNRWKEQKL